MSSHEGSTGVAVERATSTTTDASEETETDSEATQEEQIAEKTVDLVFSGVNVLLGLAGFVCLVLSGALFGTGLSVPLLTAGGAFLGSIAFFQSLKKLLKILDRVLTEA